MVDGVTYLPLPGARAEADWSRAGRIGAPARTRSFVVDDADAHVLGGVAAIVPGGVAAVVGEGFVPPLVTFVGPTGVGKSHLALALARVWHASRPEARVVITTGADFARMADRSGDDGDGDDGEVDNDTSHRAGRRRNVAWEYVRLFVLDNVDDLARKPAAQRELCAVLDTLAAFGGRAIVTVRRSAARDDRLSAGLASRLQAGLTVPLGKLSKAARQAVVSELAHARGLALSQGAIERIAGRAKTTVPQLMGTLLRLDAAARAERRALDEAFVEERQPTEEGGEPTIWGIAQRVAQHFDAKVSDLRGPARRKEVVAARSVAIYLARRLTGTSLQAIGNCFGGRDHATVAYNVEKVESALAAGDAIVCRAVALVQEAFDETRDS